MSLPAFALQVLPVSLLALAATAMGSAAPLNQAWRLPLLLAGVMLFAALLTFRSTPGWNLALLLGLAAAAGVFLGSAFTGAQGASWGGALRATLVLMGMASAIGHALRGRLRRAGFALWMLAWIYLAGWLVLVLMDPAAWQRALWAGAGLAIFGCLVVVWFSELANVENPGRGLAVPQGCDLYLLGLNIAVAARVLLISLAGS